MRQLPPTPTVDPDGAERAARAVLSDRKYIEAARPPTLRERFFDWVGEQITELLQALSSGGGRGIIAWIIVGVFLAVIAFLLMRLLGSVDPVRKARPSPEIDVELFADRSIDEWTRAAEDAERAGDWREGLRCRHRVLVAELLDRDVIDRRPGRTAADIALLAGERVPAATSDLDAATRLFEDVWYGWRDADSTTRDAFVAHVASAVDHVGAAQANAAAGVSAGSPGARP
jgi:hypothetical protein